MPQFDATTQGKIAALRALRAARQPVGGAYELVKVSWPEPDGEIYYSVLKVDEAASVAPPVSPIQTRLIPESRPDWFLPVSVDASIGDEEVDLTFWDGDGAFSDLLVEHGEGVKVELFYWFPAVELLLPIWQGHLRQEDEADVEFCKVKAVQGFRSSDAMIPHRAHWRECQAIFGGVFDTQEEIDEHDCPYNRHIGGGTGNLNGASPFTSCPRRTRQDCIDRLGNNANFMLSHQTIQSTVVNNQTKGPRLLSTSQGNETNLKEPVRVVMGERRVRGFPAIAYRKDHNNRDPEHGFFFAIYEACEGPIESISLVDITVDGRTQPAAPERYGFRLGTKGQTPVDTNLTVHSYSGTAQVKDGFGWVDPQNIDPGEASGSGYIRGLNNLRVYTDPDTYTEQWTSNRAWQIMRLLTDKRWGYGLDFDRLNIQSFIDAAEWCEQAVRFVDDNGDAWDHTRSRSDVELIEKKVQQQVEDLCLAGRLSRPFLFNGKIHIVPLRKQTSGELAAAPVFTDEGTSRNIIWENGKTTLRRKRISDLDLANRVECTYDDAENGHLEQPLRPVEDIPAQLRAGRVVGDHSRKTNVKKYPLLGVTKEAHAMKVAWSLLDLGPFDEGGLSNNLELTYKVWFMDALDLYPTKVVKVESSQITRYNFDYFRIKKIDRESKLHYKLTVQAYPLDYLDEFETDFVDLPEPEVVEVDGVGTAGHSANDGPTIPIGTQVNDLLVMAAETRSNEAFPIPDGWTEAPDSPVINVTAFSSRLTVCWKFAEAGESSPVTIDDGALVRYITQIIAIRGATVSANPFNVTNKNNGGPGAFITTAGATTTEDNALVLVFVGANMGDGTSNWFDGWTNADLAGVAERMDASTGIGFSGAIGMATGVKATAGAYGGTTVTADSGSWWETWTGAITVGLPTHPEPEPPPPPTDPLVFGDITYGSGVLTINFEAS